MRAYNALKSMLVYTESEVALPKGEKPGFGNCVILLAPSKEHGFNSLNNSFFAYKRSMYRHYLIDLVYKDKIGYKRYVQNNTGVFKKEFTNSELAKTLTMVGNGNKASVIKQQRNLILNLGEWLSLYFSYQVKRSKQKICEDFFRFIRKHIDDSLMEHEFVARSSEYSPYQKILYIDVDEWLAKGNLALDRAHMTNPLSILLVALYKFPETLTALAGMDILITSTKLHTIMKIENQDIIPDNYGVMKNRIMRVIGKNRIDEEKMDETVVVDEVQTVDKPVDEMTTKEIVTNSIKKKETAANKARRVILNSLTKNLLGEVDDATDEDDSATIQSDDPKIQEMQNIANNYIDEHPELLEDTDSIQATKEVIREVKKKYYIHDYTSKYTDKQLKEMQKLSKQQVDVIGDLDDEISNLESKTIDPVDLSDNVKTNNPNITESRFVNFDRSYLKKKFEKNIDAAVGMLSTAKVKVFVIDKKVEDSSTPLDLKKTYTYTLVDENGRKMTLKFDIPVIFDDHFMLIGGNKKIIQHTLILKPIVKTDDDTVQIATNYQKMFIMRKGSADLKTTALMRHLNTHKDQYDVINGNGVVTNKKYASTLEYNSIAKKIVQFKIDDNVFILDTVIFEKVAADRKIDISKVDTKNELMIGIDGNGKLIKMKKDASYIDTILSYLPEETVASIKKYGAHYNGGKLLMYSETKPMNKRSPLILILLYWEGFTSVMKKAGIEYEIIPKSESENLDIDLYEWGITEMEDGYIKWKRYPTENSMLMNGLNALPMHLYSIKDLDNKDTYSYLITNIYDYSNMSFNLDQYYDFMIDPITKELLHDMHLPENIVDLCILANKMLKVDDYTPEGELRNMRVRSNEIIPFHTYKAITSAYGAYRKEQHKRKPNPISVKQDAVIREMMKQTASAMNDASSLNPILEISKLRAVTYKGENGTNMDKAFSLDVRAYNESMLGVLGITTSPDSGVGINRQLTLEPNIVSTYGLINSVGEENVDSLNSAQLFAPTELLTPLGAQHDDPTRTSMSYKQTMYMVMVDQSDPVLIGNGVEKVLPYHLSSEFVVTADEDGQVVEKTDEFLVVKYKNGKFRTIDLTPKICKNAASGFYIEIQHITNLKEGEKFKKGTVLSWDDKAFQKNDDDRSASMRLGAFVKVAVIPEWDIYEDSIPVSRRASEKLATTMVMPVHVALDKSAYISKIVEVGDHVDAGDNVIVFDNYHEDDEVAALINSLRASNNDEVIETNYTTKKTHYTGVVRDIEILTTVPVNELSESLQEVVNKNWEKIRRRDKILDKYKNSDDLKYYKSGNVITASTDPVKPDYRGKVKGHQVDDGVLITFYIAFKDILARGDKVASEFALKGTTSHVIEPGLEPYAESDPDDPIDVIVAPLSISARKTPTIFPAMFGNKILINAKKHIQDFWNNN